MQYTSVEHLRAQRFGSRARFISPKPRRRLQIRLVEVEPHAPNRTGWFRRAPMSAGAAGAAAGR